MILMSAESQGIRAESPQPLVERAAPQIQAKAAIPSLSQQQVRRALRLSIWEGALATIPISITGAIGGSVFLTGFALLLGANSFQLGLLGALPFIGQLFGFLSAYLEERLGARRMLVLISALGGRLIWVVLLALPFLSFLRGAEVAIFLLGIAISHALNGMAGNAWLSWMSDLVPPRERGRYFGVRNMVGSVVAMAVTFGAGLVVDHFRADGQEALGYALIFSVAVITAIGAALVLAQQPEPPLRRDAQARLKVGELFSLPLRDSRFRTFTLVAAAWAMATGIAAPFFNAYGLEQLNLSFAMLSLQAIVTSAVALVFQPLIGRLQDSLGDRTVLLGSICGTLLLPWGWVLSTPDNIMPLWFTSVFSGIFWPGISQGMVNVLMDRAPVVGRGAAIACYGAVTGLGTFVAGLLSGVVATALVDVTIALGPLSLSNLTILFVGTSIARGIVLLMFWRTL
jgi:MFS family permease